MIKNHQKNIKNKKKKKENFKKLKKPNENEEIQRVQSEYENINAKVIKFFTDFPLSWKTLKGLQASKYKIPTLIQKESIGHALQGHDILGAAVTGSGKTLAFLIPILENLFIKKWSRTDGVGAIVISPTRELAYQIFETVKKIGAHHDISVGLIIGGKNLKFERSRMDQCNIIICTPGRLLQHMDENPLFNSSTMQILVLDEADRCLDMGFQQTMNGIIENLPPDRQTLLFSATQTKSVENLARLSLKNPIYIAPHEQQQQSLTPKSLQQNYIVIELQDKITMLWSFIKNHLKQKSIIFLSTCKQVKYIYEIFCKLRPGTSLLALYGTLHQDRRVAIYNEFCRKSNVVMFATDIASRGLDFPIVNWVIQLDCPEDSVQYIHRAGRTARHNAKGESLLVLLPNEENGMLEELKFKNILLNKIDIDSKKLFTPRAKMEAFLAAHKELKESAQRAFVSYIKSVVLMKNKNIFNVDYLDIDAFANSLGLLMTPRVRFLEKLRKRQTAKNAGGVQLEETDDDNEENSDEIIANTKNDTQNSNDEESDDDLLQLKRKDHKLENKSDQEFENEDEDEDLPNIEEIKVARQPKVLTKAAIAKRVIKKKIIANKRVQFTDDGNEVLNPIKHLQSELGKEYLNEDHDDSGINIENAKKLLIEEDKFDKQRFRDMIKAKHKDKKKKIKNQQDQEYDDFGGSDNEDNEVDLSWLPNPDHIYGPEQTQDNNDDDETFHKLPDKLYVQPDKKRKKHHKYKTSSNSELDSDDNDDVTLNPIQKKTKLIVKKLDVDAAEELAMKLLGNN